MNRQFAVPVRALVATVVTLTVGHSHAEVIDGLVTGGSSGGVFAEVSPPAEAGPDAFESPDLIAFDELQDVVLAAPLRIGPAVVLGVGSIVSSHYVVFDPAAASTLEGFVEFDEPIIGLAIGPEALDATEPLFGISSVLYSTSMAIGPDGMDSFGVDPSLPNRLLVQYGALSPGDHLRVLTGVALPEPAALLLGGLALTGVAGLRP